MKLFRFFLKKFKNTGNTNSSEDSITKISNHELEEFDNEELSYFLSNNVSDIDRQHMHHFFKQHVFQGNFSSPIEDKLIQGECKVLDVCCGPGTWLLDLSSKYQNSYFWGIDLKPVFPYEIKPNNLEFIEADIFDGLPFGDNELDLVHVETMSFILTSEQWDFVLSELVRVTKPGGYVEITESINCFNDEGPIVRKLSEGICASCLKRNVDISLIPNLDSKLELQPNITKVHRNEKRVIMGPNGGKIGLVSQELFMSFLDMAIEILSGELGISKELFKHMVEIDLLEELKHTSPEGFSVRFWAQKNVN